jgi:hypothetical protein
MRKKSDVISGKDYFDVSDYGYLIDEDAFKPGGGKGQRAAQ